MAKKYIYIIFILLAIITTFCTRTETEQEVKIVANTYLNLAEDVEYVGMETCRTCHADIHETFIHTGMGRSFDKASREKSDAIFDKHAIVYDDKNDFYYKPFFENDELFVKEFRLANGDTTHSRTEKISYIIGSGQHTNSHLLDINGYVHQAPITFYTQDEKWDLAPGFEQKNERFSRIISTECLTCHNHLPKHVKGSENKYTEMPTGIECERCHGPGSIHVREKKAGNVVDINKEIDYTIVNPRKLSVDLQMDLCQRCHLQGIAVLNEGKTFYDFRPGMKLAEVMNVFLPRYTNSHERFIMASQADRLRLSECFKTGEMSCITCHNPHKSIEATAVSQYNDACKSCHKTAKDVLCSETETARKSKNDNCVSCHMPRSGSIDIPHINISDHYISKENTQSKVAKRQNNTNEIAQFLGLEILTKTNPEPLEMAKGYIALYDKFSPDFQMLDSAKRYIDRSKLSNDEKFKTFIHYYFARFDYNSIINLAINFDISKINDGWTAYRIGEAFFKNKQLAEAQKYYEKSVQFKPFNLDFQQKLGTTYAQLRNFPQAQKTFEFILKENPKRPDALTNLGFILVSKGDYRNGEAYYQKALALNPDYEQALMNQAGIHLQRNELAKAKGLLQRVLRKNMGNERAKEILEQL
ncbi:MAG: putative CXXCH cytochrome family protein [Saprospiraceae bacterium]|jgi:predicted CXXCH cytochrome family protein